MYHNYQDGFVEVISGCMFAGKTEELLRRIRVLSYGNQKIQLFKPMIDNRYDENKVVSHAGNSMESTLVKNAKGILENLDPDTKIVAVDEIQFFDDEINMVIDKLADSGIRVMVAGLDMDFRGEPFGVMPMLMTKAEFVTKLTAVCTRCGAPGTRSQRIINGKPADYYDPIIMVGASESYEAVCRHCHTVPSKPCID
ncbi:MAG TPA: thymidine kinase [Erysipelotrichaceae bacterium]|nr:thymidine kinase [Erysipelotrichaceae bacterium]